MRLRGLVFYLAVLMCLTLCITAGAQGQLDYEIIKGGAVISGGDVTGARKEALENVFRLAVTDKVSSMVPASVLEGDDSGALEEQIYSRSREFISRYIISKEYRDQNQYFVEAQVYVSEESLRSALLSGGFLEKEETGPVFVVALEQRQDKYFTWWASAFGTQGVPSVCEAFFSSSLKEMGYSIIEPIPSQKRPALDKIVANPCGEDTLREISELSGAGLCICARAKSSPVERRADTGAIISEARLEARLFNLETIENIAKYSAHSRGEADTVDNADKLALEQAAKNIFPELAVALGEYHPGVTEEKGDRLEVVVSNIRSYRHYDMLNQAIESVPGVQGMELWGFMPGSVKFFVNYSGRPMSFANTLAKKNFQEFELKIIELDKNRVELRLDPVRYKSGR